MLDWLTNITRRRAVYVVAALLTTVAVVGPWLLARSSDGGDANDAATTTTDAFIGTDVTSPLPTTTPSNPTASTTGATTIAANSTTVSPTAVANGATTSGSTTTSGGTTTPGNVTSVVGTTIAETNRDKGDDPNPSVLYPGRPDIGNNDQERAVGIGTEPARLSGFSVWTENVTAEAKGPDGATGPFLRITIRIINRDNGTQGVSDSQWTLLTPQGVVAPTSYATPGLVNDSKMAGNSELRAEVWFPASSTGRYWLRFRPDQGSARGIWAIDVS